MLKRKAILFKETIQMLHKLKRFNLLLLAPIFFFACSTKKDIDAFKEAKYELAGIDALTVSGINLLDKKKPEDFSFGEAATLFSAFSENDLAAISTLGLQVQLPEGSENRSMTVTQLKWQLLVDGKQALSGLVSEPVQLKNGLNTITVKTPVKLSEENGKVNYNQILQLTSLLNKDDANRPPVVLQIKPTIETSVGPVELPSFINIKD